MASSSKANSHNTERTASSSPVPPVVESFAQSGEINVSLPRNTWLTIAGALSIAAGVYATDQAFEQMATCNSIANFLASRLGLGGGMNQQVNTLGESPPARAAAASA